MKRRSEYLTQGKLKTRVAFADTIVYRKISSGVLIELDAKPRSDGRIPRPKKCTFRATYGIRVGKCDKAKEAISGEVSPIFSFYIG